MSGVAEHNDAVTIVTVQLIISLMILPVTPVLWICGSGGLSTPVQRLSQMSPAAWSMFFCLLMPGGGSYFLRLMRKAFIPSDMHLSMLSTTLGALAVLFIAVGAYVIATYMRWGRKQQAELLRTNQRIISNSGFGYQQNGRNENSNGVRQAHTSNDDDDDDGCNFQLHHVSLGCVVQFLFPVVEAVFVELAWRVYLLPRLLFSLSPVLALTSMALLATLSMVPTVLYAVCVDVLIYPEDARYLEDAPMISRHPPSSATIMSFTAHLFFKNLLLGTLAMIVDFCIWPAVVCMLYWEHVAKIVSGGMLIRSYLPIGMNEMFMARRLADSSRRLVPSGWLRGPPWKVSCEAMPGIVVALPVVFLSCHHLLSIWSYTDLKSVLPVNVFI